MSRFRSVRAERRAAGVLLSILWLAVAGCGQSPDGNAPGAQVVVFEGATLILGDGGVIPNGAFAVADGRFAAVGEPAEMPADAVRVDLTGMTVMPAIVDAHTHLSTTRDALIVDLERRAYFGVGAAVSLGADGEGAPLELRHELIPNAARYLSAGLGITAPEPGRSPVHWVTTEEQARQAVRDEAARGVDLIKIWVDDRNGQYEKLSPALYAAIIDEAHKAGLRATAHIFALEDGKGLLRAGIDLFAHGVRDRDIDDEFVDLARQRPEVLLVPNLPARGRPTDLGWLEGSVTPAELESLRAGNVVQPAALSAYSIQARNLARLNEAGMTIAFGTDGNTPWAPHIEMEDMVVAGMAPAEVIVAATRNAAEVAGLADMGTIETGMSADFIVLEANPLDDITNTRRIAAVYLRGDEVDRDAIRERVLGTN